MTNSRRKFTAEQKADIVRRHLKGKEPISAIAEELSLQPTQIHQWVAMVVEQAERAFEKTAKSDKANKLAEAKINALKEQQIRRLQEKLIHKNEVIAELMEENVRAKKGPSGFSVDLVESEFWKLPNARQRTLPGNFRLNQSVAGCRR